MVLVKKTFGSLALRAATLVSKFVLIILLGRYLSEEELGEYGLLITFVMLAQTITGLELQRYTSRRWIQEDDEDAKHKIFGQHLGTVVLSFIVVAAIFVGLQQSGYVLLDAKVPILQVVLLLFFNQLAQEAERFLYAMQKPVLSGAVLFVRSGLWVPVLFFVDTLSLEGVVNIWLGAQILAVLMVAAMLRKDVSIRLPSVGFLWKGFGTAKFYIVGVSALFAMPYVDMYVLKENGYLEQTGVLALFVAFSKAVYALLSTGATSIFQPLIIEAEARNPKGKKLLFMQYAVSLSFIYAGSLIAAMVLLKPILIYIGKDFYLDNAYVYWWLLGSVGLLAASDVFRVALYAKGKDFTICVNYVAAFLVSLGINLTLVPVHGIKGTIFAIMFGYGVLLLANAAAFFVHQRSTFAASNSETKES